MTSFYSALIRNLGRLFVLTSILSAHIHAQSNDNSSQLTPIASILTDDGSLRASGSGSFDPAGYQMVTGANGAPRFVGPDTSTGCADGWDTSFSINGTNGPVRAIATDGLGNIYIGGRFTVVNNIFAKGIAKWDGANWSALGDGVGDAFGGAIYSIAISGTDIYVGGSFASAGDVQARNVAKWNGSSWSALGNGLGGGTHFVQAVAIYKGDVYFGGNFSINGGSPANGIVRWDGSAYSSVGAFLGQVKALAVSGGALYAGGIVAPSAGSNFGIMKWDGTAWSTLGTSNNTSINAIAFSGTDLYVVGSRIVLPGQNDSQVAKFDGTTWTRMASFTDGILNAVAVHDGDVFVGGYLPFPNNVFNNIAKWNGTAFTGVGGGVTGGTSLSERVTALGGIGDTLFVGGNFATAGGLGARNIAKVTAAGTWSAFNGTGIDSAAAAIAVSGTDVFVGGGFNSTGETVANKIAKWNSVSNTWSPLGAGLSGASNANRSISAIAVAGGKVYAGGDFTSIGGVAASRIAVWNGTNWAPLGTGVDDRVTVIVARGDDVYVGGSFQTAGGAPATRLAKWNGTSWESFPAAPIPNTVSGITFMGDDMYVGAGSTTADNPNYLLKYDGTSWTGIFHGAGGHGVTSIAISGNDIYASGGFQSIGGVSAQRVAKWNGTAWSALGSGLPGNSSIVRLAMSGNDLIAVGDFTTAGGNPANRAARWNGSEWIPLGNGLNGTPSNVIAAGGNIYVGGEFTTAGCNLSPFFARWRETVWTGSTNTDWHTAANWGSGAVPASNSSISIVSSDSSIVSADVTLSDLIVANGRTLTIGAGRTLTVSGTLDLGNGTITGAGTLIVNGGLQLNGNISGLAGVVVNGDLYLGGGTTSEGVPVSVTSCRANAVSGGSTTSYISGSFTRCVDGAGTFRFPVGVGGVYAPIDVSGITGSGTLTVTARSGQYSGAAVGLPANRLARYWDLANSGMAQANFFIRYADQDVIGIEGRYRGYTIDAGTAQLVPTVLDRNANTATITGATSFSAITLAEGPATFETLNGRVRSASGRGAAYVLVSLTDGEGNVRYGVSNPNGYYRINNVETWKTYTVRLQAKRFTFAQPERIVEFIENAPAVNFTSTDH